MAIYHLNAKVISRSNGQSATEAAAYRAGEKIHDERTGLTFNYTRKKGVYTTEILAPENAPHWAGNRAQLWNAAELIEKRCNSRTAREFDIALPVELTHDQKQALVRGFVTENFVNKGLVADIAFHDINSHNPHVHIMITTRAVDENGLGAKDRNLDRKDFLLKLRESWANHANQALESIGIDQRVDHRTLEEQNINRIPQIHLGANVAAMMKRGIATERAEEYDRIQEANQEIETLETQLADLDSLEAMMTIRLLMGFVNPEPQNGIRTFEGKRYIFDVSTDEEIMQLHAKDGRGLIFEKKDGSVKANLSDEDRQMLQDVNAQISRQLAEQERERERERQRLQKPRRRGRSK